VGGEIRKILGGIKKKGPLLIAALTGEETGKRGTAAKRGGGARKFVTQKQTTSKDYFTK